jgi:hypothetical protein
MDLFCGVLCSAVCNMYLVPPLLGPVIGPVILWMVTGPHARCLLAGVQRMCYNMHGEHGRRQGQKQLLVAWCGVCCCGAGLALTGAC